MNRQDALAANVVNYHQTYKSMKMWRTATFVLLTLLAVESLTDLYFSMEKTIVKVVHTDKEGRIVELATTGQTLYSTSELVTWANKAANEIFTFGHHDYRKRLQYFEQFFSDKGYEDYLNEMSEQKFLERVTKGRQVVTGITSNVPVIVKKQKINGVGFFTVEVPMTITFSAGNRRDSFEVQLTLLLERLPYKERKEQIGISQFKMEKL